MKRMVLVVAAAAVMAMMCGCGSPQKGADAREGIVSEAGQVRFVQLEEGFYGIIGEDGRKFEPINLPPEFKVNRQDVTFRAKPRTDILNAHMWGTPVEILEIKRSK